MGVSYPVEFLHLDDVVIPERGWESFAIPDSVSRTLRVLGFCFLVTLLFERRFWFRQGGRISKPGTKDPERTPGPSRSFEA
jgi:hypothetical protein